MSHTDIKPGDILHPTNINVAFLLGFALTVYHRPHLPLLLPSYRAFDDVMPWSSWGWFALVVALWLLFAPRGTGWRCIGHLLSAIFWTGVAGVFGTGVGVTSAVTTYSLWAFVSMAFFARSAVVWQSQMRWWRRATSQEHAPRWLRILAGERRMDDA